MVPNYDFNNAVFSLTKLNEDHRPFQLTCSVKSKVGGLEGRPVLPTVQNRIILQVLKIIYRSYRLPGTFYSTTK